MYTKIIKPVLDKVISIAALIVCLPLFLILILILSIANRGNPFFLQERPGKNGCIFSVIKFKTMNDRKDAFGNLLPDSERLTFGGGFIRNFSFDEIPQLINVIKGDMSLIGPRPLLVEYLSLYNEYQFRRHEVRPGITGWAQVNGRNAITWKKKFEYDVWYVDNVNFWLDVKIICLTIIKVFKSENINQQGQSTVEYFKGNN